MVNEQASPAGRQVAIIGMGPRGLSVLERLLVRTRSGLRDPLRIWVIDDVEPGVGRIWRTDQTPWVTMNTVVGQITMYSAGMDGPPRAGAGPSLAEWAQAHADPAVRSLAPNDYAPRAVYGQYLRDVYRSLLADDVPGVEVRPVQARVDRLEPCDAGWRLGLADGAVLPPVDAVILATGHTRYEPTAEEQGLLRSPAGDRYLRGDSAADLPLERVGPGQTVGVLGLGLTFYDVALILTVGRGGRFHPAAGGGLRYEASGDEPHIVAGSRSGMPLPARGRNQKTAANGYRPCFLDPAALAELRAAARHRNGTGQVDFVRDVWPLLVGDVQVVYDCAVLRRRHGQEVADRFRDRTAATVRTGGDTAALRAEFGLADVPPLDLRAMARPFGATTFSSSRLFHDELLTRMRADLRAAAEGNVDNPVKAALDVLRDARSLVRSAVDFAGLEPRSHRDDFLGWFHPLNNFLSAGPPAVRVEQCVALIEAGVVEVCGPDTGVHVDAAQGRFVLESPRVDGSRRVVDLLVEARIPQPDLRRDTSPLIRQLLTEGIISEYCNLDPSTGDEFRTGGLAVEPATFRVIDAGGHPVPSLYALGIPTEHTRWFTHMGSGRPGGPSLFGADADLVARGVLDGDREGTAQMAAAGAEGVLW